MSYTSFPQARRNGLTIQPLGDEVLLYDSTNDKAHVLNQTSALVWELANGKRSVAVIAQRLAQERHTIPDEDLVWLALNQLSKAGLLQQSVAAPVRVTSMTRRDFLQKAALAAMVIPVVKTIQSPGYQQASSCVPKLPCSTDDDCCFGLFCSVGNCVCFLPGTPILYHDGTRRPIETVKVGDLVLARDEKTGIMAPQRVDKTYVHNTQQSLWLDVNGEKIGTTATHPFYTETGWVKAIDLRTGMDCVADDGSRTMVQGVEHSLPHVHPVYNLEVSGYHTYFVGERGVWVHNRTTAADIPTQ
ncbi:MAG TPA: PqqD family peptide modification chaperone [Anaerolineae bacterium]|nr:PqqD family peptide modification chaperone [Anaerolineae bacterium]